MTELAYADFWRRGAAHLLDGLCMLGLGIGLAIVILITPGTSQSVMDFAQSGISTLVGLLISWAYYTFMESSTAQGTLGKMLMGLKVTDLEGNRISFAHANGRFFSQMVMNVVNLFFCAGFLMALFTEKKQALHDFMSSTVVIRDNE